MKYTYYSSIKSGKRIMRDLFCLNNKSAVCMSPSKPIWASCLEPFGNILKTQRRKPYAVENVNGGGRQRI